MLKVYELFSEAASMFKMFERNMRILVAVDILWDHSLSTLVKFSEKLTVLTLLRTYA